MTKIDRYILSKYLRTFLVAMALIIVIVITFDVSEKLDDFINGHAPLTAVITQYYLNFIPGFVNLYSPLFIFISVIFFTSRLAGHTEIIAILGSGISYRRMLRPYIYGSISIAILVLLLGNFVIPASNRKVAEFESQYIYTHPAEWFSNIHFQSRPGVQVYAESYDDNAHTVLQFHQDTYDTAARLVDRITCDNITYDTATAQWSGNGISHHVLGKKESLTYTVHSPLNLNLVPTDFKDFDVEITTLNTFQLVKHIHHERMRGANTVMEARIELYQRLLNPLAIIVMTFIGAGISSRKSRGGIGLHLAIGISLAFGFIVFMKVSTVFAVFGTLNPFLAVLLPQLIFGIAAAYVVKTAPK